MSMRSADEANVWELTQSPPRTLRVLVDRDTVPVSTELLELLLALQDIEVTQYSKDGPPSDVERIPADFIMPATAIGWVNIGPATGDGPFTGRPIYTNAGHSITESLLLDSRIEHSRLTLQYANRSAVGDISLEIFCLAQLLGMDLIVTHREDLLGSALSYGALQIRKPSAAIPVVSLYLRGTGRGIVAISPNLTESVTPNSYMYLALAKRLLPSAEQIQKFCAESKAEKEYRLVSGVIHKIGFALLRRDAVWRLAFQPSTVAQIEELAAEVDSFLLFTTAALDACARLVDSMFSFESQARSIGFQREDWRAKASSLAGLEFTEDHINTAMAITGLRNFTHEAGTRSVPIDIGVHEWKKTRTYVQYRRTDTSSEKRLDPLDALWKLQSSSFRSNGLDMWGLRGSNDVFLTPGPMCDVLMGGAIALVGAAAEAVVVAHGVQALPDRTGPRIRAEVRAAQLRAFLALPGTGDVELLRDAMAQ